MANGCRIDGSPGSTLGGLVAANCCGPRSLAAYGTLRDMVLGMTVVNGDGVIRKCGGKVVKNVTGYALDKLYIGSFGTIGVITEVTFKLRPLPAGVGFWKWSYIPDSSRGHYLRCTPSTCVETCRQKCCGFVRQLVWKTVRSVYITASL